MLVLGRWRWDGEAPAVCHAGVAVVEMGRSGGGSRTVTPVWGTGGGPSPEAHWSGHGTRGRGLGASRKQRDRESNFFAFWAFLLGFNELGL